MTANIQSGSGDSYSYAGIYTTSQFKFPYTRESKRANEIKGILLKCLTTNKKYSSD